jgi:hypothetical protein
MKIGQMKCISGSFIASAEAFLVYCEKYPFIYSLNKLLIKLNRPKLIRTKQP